MHVPMHVPVHVSKLPLNELSLNKLGGILLHFLPKTHLKGQISEIREHFPSGQPPTKPMGVLESLGHG